MPIVPGPGAEFADFGDRDLLFGLTSEEAWVNLTEEDLQVSGITPEKKKDVKKYINYSRIPFAFNLPVLLKNRFPEYNIIFHNIRNVSVKRQKKKYEIY